MKLSAYLARHQLDESLIAGIIGVTPKAVEHWVLGKRMPRPAHLAKIREMTAGAVTPNDFLLPPHHTQEVAEAVE